MENNNKNQSSVGAVQGKRLTSASKFMSLVLRHEPGRIGLSLDAAGWAPLAELVAKANASGRGLNVALVREVVKTCPKQRFALSEDGQRIRANQGHSIDVALDLPAVAPPPVLYHGTAHRFLASIQREGLDKRARHHVHLTTDAATAGAVGRRYGELVMLQIDAARMHADGHVFHVSANGVWLTDSVPTGYLTVLPDNGGRP